MIFQNNEDVVRNAESETYRDGCKRCKDLKLKCKFWIDYVDVNKTKIFNDKIEKYVTVYSNCSFGHSNKFEYKYTRYLDEPFEYISD